MADKESPFADLPKYPLIPTPVITYDMVQKLKCPKEEKISMPLEFVDEGDGDGTESEAAEPQSATDDKVYVEPKYVWNSPRLMLVFEDGDLNNAIHFLLASLQDPFGADAVATLLVQESILEQFVSRVAEQMRELPPAVAQHPIYLRTLAKLELLKARTVLASKETVRADFSPRLVYDFTHNYLGNGPTGVITMHSFRTPKEASQVYLKETVVYSSVCIWNEKLANAYEQVALINCELFLLNCFNADLSPIQAAFESNQNDVKIVQGYHYETLSIRNKRKLIVFPVGTIFAN